MTWLFWPRALHSLLWAIVLFIPFGEAKQLWQSLEPLFPKSCLIEQIPCTQTTQASPIPEKTSGLSNTLTATLPRPIHLNLAGLGQVTRFNQFLPIQKVFEDGSPRGPPVVMEHGTSRDQVPCS